MSLIHSALFYVLHFVLRTVLSLLEHLKLLYRRTIQITQKMFSIAPTEAELLNKFKITASTFQKFPRHVGFVFNEEDIVLTQVARFIVWCIGVGINDISILDSDDYLKSEISTLFKTVNQALERTLIASRVPNLLFHTHNSTGFNSRSISSYDSDVTNSQKDSIMDDTSNENINDLKSSKEKNEISVLLLGICDGRPYLAEAATSLCKEVQAKRFDPKDLNKHIFNKKLNMKTADPDLVLCFGRGKSLSGYLPWNVHLSEIMFHTSHIRFELCDFMDSLGNFNKCEQRFGK